MRDGRTRKHEGRTHEDALDAFLERHEATLVLVRGGPAGKEYALDGPKLVIGRGPDVDLALEDDEISSHHAAIEWSGGRFRVCDLGSTNGTHVNGSRVQVCDLAHGDRLQLGRHLLQLRLEERRSEPKVYSIQDD